MGFVFSGGSGRDGSLSGGMKGEVVVCGILSKPTHSRFCFSCGTHLEVCLYQRRKKGCKKKENWSSVLCLGGYCALYLGALFSFILRLLCCCAYNTPCFGFLVAGCF